MRTPALAASLAIALLGAVGSGCETHFDGGDGGSSSSSGGGAVQASSATDTSSSTATGASSTSASHGTWSGTGGDTLAATSSVSTGSSAGAGGATTGPGALVWARLEGGASDDGTLGLATDAAGDVVAAGFFQGTMKIGNLAPVVSAGGNDVFVAKFDTAGTPLWVQRFGGSGDDAAEDVAVSPDGRVFVVGYYAGTVVFGADALMSGQTQYGAFTVALDAAGTPQWARSLPLDDVATMQIAVDPRPIASGGGDVVIAGTWVTGGDSNAFLAAYDADGGTVFTKQFGDGQAQYGEDVAVDAQGDIVLVGEASGGISFGGPTLTSAGGLDAFVAKFDPTGAPLWSRLYGDAADQYAGSVGTDASGHVALCGALYGAADFGGGRLVSAGDADIFVAELDADGNHLWSERFGDPARQVCHKLAVDTSGNVVATGWVLGGVDFGAGLLTSAGAEDLFVVKLDPSGHPLWGRLAGDAATQFGQTITTGPSNEVIVGGWVDSSIDFGGGPLTSRGGYDALIAKLAP